MHGSGIVPLIDAVFPTQPIPIPPEAVSRAVQQKASKDGTSPETLDRLRVRAPYVNAAVGYSNLQFVLHTCLHSMTRKYFFAHNHMCPHCRYMYTSSILLKPYTRAIYIKHRCAVRCLVESNDDYDNDQTPFQVPRPCDSITRNIDNVSPDAPTYPTIKG